MYFVDNVGMILRHSVCDALRTLHTAVNSTRTGTSGDVVATKATYVNRRCRLHVLVVCRRIVRLPSSS